MINDPLTDFLAAAVAGDLSESLCGQCLDSPWGDRFEMVQMPVDQGAFDELYKSYKKLLKQGEMDFLQANFPIARRVAAVCLSTIKNNEDVNLRMAAAQQLLLMAQVPGAKGQGISSSNVLEHISGLVVKIALDEMSAEDRKKGAEDEMDAGGDDDEVHIESMNQHRFTAFFDEYSSSSSYFKGSGSDGTHSVLEAFVDGLVAIMYLGCTGLIAFSGAKEVATAALVDVATFDTPGLMSVYKMLLPCLTFSGHDVKLPTDGKARTACHHAAANVIKLVVSKIDEFHSVSHHEESVEKQDTSTATAHSSPRSTQRLSFGSPSKAVAKLPPRYAAVVGAVQRMILSCPEKAANRNAVCESICSIIDALIKTSTVAVDSGEFKSSSLNKLMSFIVNCSQSQKIPRRAFSMEIASSLLQNDTVWSACINDGANAAEGLLLSILNRCKDIAPSVRTKALSGFCDLLDTLGAMLMDHRSEGGEDTHSLSELTIGQVELCRCFYKLAISECESHHNTSYSEKNSLNAMDSLKHLVFDEKASTRVKALRAYSTALSIKWPRFVSSEDGRPQNRILDKISMLVSPDEIRVIANCCTDSSISVRKQMVDSLTDLLWSRPMDAAAQDAWVFSALPLMNDSELSIQNKVANSVMLLIIESCVAWKSHFMGKKIDASFNASTVTLGWKLCCKIADNGMVKLFRGAVMALIKEGRIGPNSGVLIKEIVKIAEIACQVNEIEKRGENNVANTDFFFDAEEVSHGGWVLMETLLEYDKNMVSANASLKRDFGELYKSEFVLNCWDRRAESIASSPIGTMLDDVRLLRALECIGVNNADMNKTDRFNAISKQIFDHISELRCPAHAIAPALSVTLSSFNSVLSTKKIVSECTDTAEFKQLLTRCGKLLNISYSVLHKVVMSGKAPADGLWGGRALPVPKGSSSSCHQTDVVGTVATSVIHSALMVVGEIAMLGFSKDEDDSFVVLPSNGASDNIPQYALSRLGSPTYKILMPDNLTKVLQMLMLERLPSLTQLDDFNESESSRWSLGSTGSQGGDSSVPGSVRAFAFVTMGKLCIRDKSKATRYVNIFLRELQVKSRSSASNASVRSNALLVLGDLCVRFTNLVDRHVGVLASCLQDEDVSVRRHSFVLLIQLLLQDFLKWRGMLLYRFLASVVDTDPEMADFARMALKKTVENKFNGIFKQHFVESIMIYNNCTCHPTYSAAETSGGSDAGESHVDLNGINLMGAENRAKRRMIYEFIMDGMTEEDKIQTTAKVVQDILAFAVDNPEYIRNPLASGSVSNGSSLSPLEEALMDCFFILESPMLKIGSRRPNRGDNGDEDVSGDVDHGESVKQALQDAKLKVMKKLSVQHMVDHVLPVIASLKHILERCRSSLQKPLMGYLVQMIKNHKEEVDKALSSDPSLKAEIDYEIRLYDKEKEQEAVRASLLAAESAAELALSLTPAVAKSTKKSLPVSVSASARRLAVQSALKSPTLKKSHSKLAAVDTTLDDSMTAETSFMDNLTATATSSPVNARRWSIKLGSFDNENVEPQLSGRESSGSTASSGADKGEFAVPRGSFGSKGSVDLPAQRKSRSGAKEGVVGNSGVTPLKKKSKQVGSPAFASPVLVASQTTMASANASSGARRGRGTAAGGDSLMSMFN